MGEGVLGYAEVLIWRQGNKCLNLDWTQHRDTSSDLRYIRDLRRVAEHALPASALQRILTLSIEKAQTQYVPLGSPCSGCAGWSQSCCASAPCPPRRWTSGWPVSRCMDGSVKVVGLPQLPVKVLVATNTAFLGCTALKCGAIRSALRKLLDFSTLREKKWSLLYFNERLTQRSVREFLKISRWGPIFRRAFWCEIAFVPECVGVYLGYSQKWTLASAITMSTTTTLKSTCFRENMWSTNIIINNNFFSYINITTNNTRSNEPVGLNPGAFGVTRSTCPICWSRKDHHDGPDVVNFEVDLVNRYLSRLWVRSFSFLGMVMDTVIRLPGV